MRSLALLACSLTVAGCFDTHGRPSDDDAGVPPPPFTSCREALDHGENGDPCDFDGSCGDALPGCGGMDPFGREVMCLGGRLTFFERTCTLAPWERCEDYVADFPHEGFPGAACIQATFGECVEPTEDPCCDVVVTCRDGVVIEERLCRHGCGPYCDGYEPLPPELVPCRGSSECESGESCVPPGAPPVCAICQPVPSECDGDADCGAGEVCVAVSLPCSCEPVLATLCLAACTEGSCPEGERCEDGHCRPIHCSEGYACPANTRCETEHPPVGESDAHGCWRLPCASDADCDCGACVNGLCYDGPGFCRPPAP